MKTKERSRTRHFNIFLVLSAVAGLSAVLIAVDPLARASRDNSGQWAGHRGAHHSAMAICDRGHQHRFGELGAYLDTWLDLDPVQRTFWSEVAREAEQSFARLRGACETGVAVDRPETTPERLALLQSVLAAGADTLRSVQPAFAEFYGTLNEEQRRMIDSLPDRHRFGMR